MGKVGGMKLQIPPNSYFFHEYNGEIYFKFYDDAERGTRIEGMCHKYQRKIISACACYEWIKFRNHNCSMPMRMEDCESMNYIIQRSIEQIQAWEKWGE
jgi:hypothetical protein